MILIFFKMTFGNLVLIAMFGSQILKCHDHSIAMFSMENATRLPQLGGHVGVPRALKNGEDKERPLQTCQIGLPPNYPERV
jgi:hypothetical protein